MLSLSLGRKVLNRVRKKSNNDKIVTAFLMRTRWRNENLLGTMLVLSLFLSVGESSAMQAAMPKEMVVQKGPIDRIAEIKGVAVLDMGKMSGIDEPIKVTKGAYPEIVIAKGNTVQRKRTATRRRPGLLEKHFGWFATMFWESSVAVYLG